MKEIYFYLSVLLLTVYSLDCRSQHSKPALGPETYRFWPSVESPSISDDGRYVMYKINNQTANGETVIIQSTESEWKKLGIIGGFFTGDSKKVIYKNKDSILALSLGTNEIETISHKVQSYKKTMDRNWIAYQQFNDSTLFLRSLFKNRIISVANVTQFEFNDQGNLLLIETHQKQGSSVLHSLFRMELPSMKRTLIWSEDTNNPSRIGALTFGYAVNKLAFLLTPEDSPQLSSIWSYENGLDERAKLRASFATGDVPNGYYISAFYNGKMLFNKKEDKLFFALKKIVGSKGNDAKKEPVIIWNYTDEQYPTEKNNKEMFTAVLNNNNDIHLLETEDDLNLLFSSKECPIGDYLFSLQLKHAYEPWHKEYRYTTHLVSTKDGSRKEIINCSDANIGWSHFSPDEKFVIWFNKSSFNYYSYEVRTGITRNISKGIPFPLYDDIGNTPVNQKPFGFAGWVKNNEMCLIYDRFDLWLIDLKGVKLPVNLTNGYGRMRNITFGIINNDPNNEKCYAMNSQLILGGFNRKTKINGFYSLDLGKNKLIQREVGSNISFIARTIPHTYVKQGSPPIKAKNAEAYISFRSSAEESPNIFFTKNFRTYKQISNVYPEHDYNWLTSELVNWKTDEGKSVQGILYKPENFDSEKKYPVIFCYYEEQSDNLHNYLKPGLSNANLNIPQYVSNGYIVFVPDIHYDVKHPGISALNCVVSAAKYLSSFAWVDIRKLGIQGQSFGGFETNFIVTHSNIFSAACSGAAVSNVISKYGQGFAGIQDGAERGQGRLGGPPYKEPKAYMENSSIFHVEKVTTPLLLWHGNQDTKVPFSQSLEMYISLRRAGKKVWLLQYPDGDHALYGNEAIDLDSRTRQFFDYYLKNKPIPSWLQDGNI